MTMFAVAKPRQKEAPAYLLKSHDKISGQYLRFNGNLFISKICLQGSLENVALAVHSLRRKLERMVSQFIYQNLSPAYVKHQDLYY